MIELKLKKAYVQSSEAGAYGDNKYTEAKIVQGESSLRVRSYDPLLDLTEHLKPETIFSGTFAGDFSKPSNYAVGYVATALLPETSTVSTVPKK